MFWLPHWPQADLPRLGSVAKHPTTEPNMAIPNHYVGDNPPLQLVRVY